MTDDAIFFGDVRKSKTHIIRVRLEQFNGRPYVRLELWEKRDDETGEGTSTGKTYAQATGAWEQLVPLIEAACAEGARRYPRGRR